MPKYEDFSITVNGSAGNYTVEARGPSASDIAVPPQALEMELTPELHNELELIAQGFTPTRERVLAVGTLLFNALFPRRIARAFSRSFDELPPETHLRLKLAIRPPELNRLPWELLYDPDEEVFLAARLSFPVIRYVESGSPAASLLAPKPLRLLYLQALPKGQAPLNLETSEQALRQNLADQGEVTAVRDTTSEKFRAALRQKFHILHYDGHAYFDQEQQSGALVLEDQEGGEHMVSGELLATFLDGSTIRLVVLAACESGMDSPTRRFSGIAQQLMKTSSLPAVVAMQFAVRDSSAIAFNKGFYAGLASGMPVEAAVVEGRRAILESLAGDPYAAPDWATPVLFMRAKDGNLFDPPASEESAAGGAGTQAAVAQPAPAIQFGNGATVHGGIQVGNRNISTGNINASGNANVNIAAGDIHQTTFTQVGGGGSDKATFTLLVGQIRSRVEKAGLDGEVAQEALEMIQKAEEQAAKDKPLKPLIQTRLKNMVELVEAAGGSAGLVAQLNKLVEKALEAI